MSKMTREEIREQTMQLIFQMDAVGDFDYQHLTLIPENEALLKEKQAIATLESIKKHLSAIDSCINQNTDKWKTDRIARTDLAILRLAVCEIYYIDSIPDRVSVNEAVRIAKKYGSERSYAFVNSVLGKIVRSRSRNNE